MANIFPRIYSFMTVTFRIAQEVKTVDGQSGGWSPRSQTAIARAARAFGRALDSNNNLVSSEKYDATPGAPLPAGPTVPDDCMREDLDAFHAVEDIVPAFVSGKVTLHDEGTRVNAGGPQLIATVVYQNDKVCGDPPSSNCDYKSNLLLTHVLSQGSGFGGIDPPLSGREYQAPTQAETITEPIPRRDPTTGGYFIDPVTNTTVGAYRNPVLGLNVHDPDTGLVKKHRWVTQVLTLRLLRNATTSALGYMRTDGLKVVKRRPHPSYPTGFGPNGETTGFRRLGHPAGPFLQPGVPGQDEDPNNNFDLCMGLIRVQINETGTDAQGNPVKFYAPFGIVNGVGFLIDDPNPIPNADDPYGIDQALTPQPSPSQLGGWNISGVYYGYPQSASLASSTGYVTMAVPEGVYNIKVRYNLVGGGRTTIPAVTTSVGCGEVVELTPELTIDVATSSCTNDGAATVTGRARVAGNGVTVQTIAYAIFDSAGVQVGATETLQAPAGGWGEDATFAFDLSLPTQCDRYSVEVTSTASDNTTATRSTFIVYQDSTLPTITYTPTGDACSTLGTIAVPTTTIGGTTAPNDLPFSFSAQDNCDPGFIPVVLSSSEINPNLATLPVGGPYTVTAATGDACGNNGQCDFEVEVVDRDCSTDTSAPLITVVGDISVEDTDGDGSETVDLMGQATAADPEYATPIVAASYDPMSGTAFPVGTTAVTVSATNGCGLTATATFDVIVEPAPLSITCPGDLTVSPDAGTCGAAGVELGQPSALGGTVSNDAPASFPAGTTTTVTWTVTAESGQAVTCEQLVTVEEDDSAPVITACAAAPSVVSAGTDCSFAAPDLTGEVVADSCSGIASVTQVPAPGTPLGPGQHHFSFTVTDANGATATCGTDDDGGEALTVLPRLHLIFQQPPVRDDNEMDDIETDADAINRFKVGSRIPVKTKLLACGDDTDLTEALAGLVTVKLDVTLREETGSGVTVVDVPEDYTGVGDAGGIMVSKGNHFHYNLDTSNGFYPTGTYGNPGMWFRVHVMATYDTDPDVIVGEEDATLESK